MATEAQKIFPPEPGRVPLFPAESHRLALAGLNRGLNEKRHLLYLTGPPGSGKSAVLHELRRGFGHGLIGMVTAPAPGALLFQLAGSLALEVPDDDVTAARRRLSMALSVAEARQQRIVQIIDHADGLPAEDLTLLLHVFHPGFATVILACNTTPYSLMGTHVAAEADCVFRLDPLTAEETAGYILHHLRHMRLPEDLFETDALSAVHTYSEGLPRVINTLCETALAAAGRHGEDSVTESRVLEAAAGLSLDIGGKAGATATATAAGSQSATTPVEMSQPIVPGKRPVARSRPGRPSGRKTAPRRRDDRRWRATAIVATLLLTLALGRDWLVGQTATVIERRAQTDTIDINTLPPPAAGTARLPELPLPAVPDATPAEVTEITAPTPVTQEPADASRVTAPPEDTGSRPMAAAERRSLGRIYAERAEYEMSKHDLDAARISIERGLEYDPHNAALRRMQARLQELFDAYKKER